MKNIVLIAPPGAGKGTLSEKLVETYNYVHISTGDLIRNHKEYQKTIESGSLISDQEIIYMLKNKLKEINKSKPFILDGFPRTYEQVVHMINLFKDLNINDYIVINFDVEKEILIDRILNRVICNNCKHIYNLKYLNKDNICPKCGNLITKRNDDKTLYVIENEMTCSDVAVTVKIDGKDKVLSLQDVQSLGMSMDISAKVELGANRYPTYQSVDNEANELISFIQKQFNIL